MKNPIALVTLLTLMAGAAFAIAPAPSTSWTDNLSAKMSIGFESEYVSRGWNVGHNDAMTSVEVSYKLYKGSLYAGFINHSLQTSRDSSIDLFLGGHETDMYVGYKFPLCDKITADLGTTYYWYTSGLSATASLNGGTAIPMVGPISDMRREVYAGLLYSGLYVDPAVYLYYDFDREAWTAELSGKHSFDLAKCGLDKTSLDVSVYTGALSAENALTNQANIFGSPALHDGYVYYGVNADLVYSFTKTALASVGIGYAGNNDHGFDGGAQGQDGLYDRENSFYWRAKFSAGF